MQTEPTEPTDDVISHHNQPWSEPRAFTRSQVRISKKEELKPGSVADILRYLQADLWMSSDGNTRYIKAKKLSDGDQRLLHVEVDQLCYVTVPKGMLEEAIALVCAENTRNAFEELYFRNLSETNTNHIEDWLPKYFGAEDNKLNRAIGKHWIASAAARMMDPGCYIRCVLILMGPQGCGKTHACKTLAPKEDWYASYSGSLEDTMKAAQTLAGKSIIELGENNYAKKTSVEHQKQFFTDTFDTYVPKYSNYAVDVKRTQSYIITTNCEDILNDPSGNDRFWAVEVGDEIDIKGLAAIKDELWREAYDLYTNHKDDAVSPLIMTPAELLLLNVNNKKYAQEDPLAEHLTNILGDRTEVSLLGLLTEVQGQAQGLGLRSINRIILTSALKNAGWELHKSNKKNTWRKR